MIGYAILQFYRALPDGWGMAFAFVAVAFLIAQGLLAHYGYGEKLKWWW